MATINRKVQSGNTVKVLFDGQEIGLIQNVSTADDYGPEPASGIGDIHVQEYVPTMARHTLSVTGMVLRKNAMREAGIIVENGDDALVGRVFDFVVFENETAKVLRTYRGCSFASGSMDVQKHAILMQSAQFYALDVDGQG